MTWVDDLKTDIATFGAKLEHIDADAVTKVEAIKATPAGAAAFEALHDAVTAVVPPSSLSLIEGFLRALIPAQPAPAEPQQAAPAGFTTGGQA